MTANNIRKYIIFFNDIFYNRIYNIYCRIESV